MGGEFECLDGFITENVEMRIPVIFVNGQVGHIHAATLDHLILEKEIVAFRRSEGWVQVGYDPIRKAQRPSTRPGFRRDDLLLLPVL